MHAASHQLFERVRVVQPDSYNMLVAVPALGLMFIKQPLEVKQKFALLVFFGYMAATIALEPALTLLAR